MEIRSHCDDAKPRYIIIRADELDQFNAETNFKMLKEYAG
jgi:hypothetical protein